MRKKIIFGLGAAGIVLNSISSFADSDEQKYPATNFQPKVIFVDKSAVSTSAAKAEFDPKYPAANFQPKVIFIDKAVSTSSRSRKKAVFDPKFPAANFEPKVIYPEG